MLAKKYIAKGYFITVPKVIRQERNTVRRNELQYLKHNLRSRQTVFSKPINKNRSDIFAFRQISDILTKRKEEKKVEKDEEVEREAL